MYIHVKAPLASPVYDSRIAICVVCLGMRRVHHKQIVANQMLVSIIDSLKQVTRERVTQLKVCVALYMCDVTLNSQICTTWDHMYVFYVQN